MRTPVPLFALLLAAGAMAAAPVPKAAPGMARVRLETSAGSIVLALDQRRAPITSRNFLAYVDDGRFEGTFFYRAARREGAPKLGFIQGGIDTDARRALDPIMLEPSGKTGIRHTDGAISMARFARESSATGNFTIEVGPDPGMDAKPGYPGYAAFGHVIAGMDVVRQILAAPSGGGKGDMKGQMILKPIRLIRAVRLDGEAHPTSALKPWLIWSRH